MATVLDHPRRLARRKMKDIGTIEVRVHQYEVREEAEREFERAGRKPGQDKKNWVRAEARMKVEKVRKAIENACSALHGQGRIIVTLLLVMEDDMGGQSTRMVGEILDSEGRYVGLIEKPAEGPCQVTLDEPWYWIAEAINTDIREGKPLATRNHKLITVTKSGVVELGAIRHAIEVLSERGLQVTDNQGVEKGVERVGRSSKTSERTQSPFA